MSVSSILCFSLRARAEKCFSSAFNFSISARVSGLMLRGFSAEAGVEVVVACGVRALPSLESLRRIAVATVFIASPFLGVLSKLRSEGAVTAGDLKACFTGVVFDFAVSTTEILSDFGRLGAGSEGLGSADGRLRDWDAGFGIAASGVSSSESEESLGRADGCSGARAVSAGELSLFGFARNLSKRSI